MATLSTVRLNKGDSPNWGFRLQGGKDFGTPLVIQKVNGGSPAERAGLVAGDAVIKINNIDVFNLLHKEAQDVIVRAGPNFEMVIQRGGSTWKPSVVPTGTFPKPSPSINNVSPVTKTSLAATKGENIGAIGTGHNLAAKPFAPQVNGAVNGAPKLVNKQYNTPLKLYSEDAIAETISAQSEVLPTGALGVNFKKNEKNYDATSSAVYRMLKEAETEPEGFSNDQEPDSGIVTAPNKGIAGLRHVVAPQTKPAPSNPQIPPGQNICAECERLIVGVFVRIKEKNLHVECFKCSTCGSSLKNVGYYNINNKLYCDIHAKAAAIAVNNPNSIPITISPVDKAPANAISSALSTHSLPSPSPLSPKTPTYAPSYQPEFEEPKEAEPAVAVVDDSTSAPAPATIAPSINQNSVSQSNTKPSSNSSIYNPSAPLSFSKFINKPGNTGAPKAFSSVSAPLSPGGTLPRTVPAPPSPHSNFNRAPLSPSAPSYGSYSPSSTAGHSTNIIWPPPQEISDKPTACPLFYPPPSKVEAEIEKKASVKKKTQFEAEYFSAEADDNNEEVMSSYSEEISFSGQKTATECVEILSETLDTQKLVENVIKSSPSIAPAPIGTPALDIAVEDSKTHCPLSLALTECCQKMEFCDLKKSNETPENPLPTKIENVVPQKWESELTQAARTTSPDPDTFSRIPTRTSAGPMVSALSVAPSEPFNPLPHSQLDPVPLPEYTEAYFPPEHLFVVSKPEEEVETKKEPLGPIPKPYSPFVRALEVAPERPFTPVGEPPAVPLFKKKPKDPLDVLIDELPKSDEKLDMKSALTTAPERPYTPLISEFTTSNAPVSKQVPVDRSQLIKPPNPEELPASFQINKKEPKPPSYYSPAMIEQRIQSGMKEHIQITETQHTSSAVKKEHVCEEIIQKTQTQTIRSSDIAKQQIEPSQQIQSSNNFPPIFQGFSCSFKNKTDHSQFSIEVSTTPPVPTPPPKPTTPIAYVATVENEPSQVIMENLIQQSTNVQQATARKETISRQVEKRTDQKQEVQKQAEEVIQVKAFPVTSLLRKPEVIPTYQQDLQASAEAEILLIERKRRAGERLEQQKREKELQQQHLLTKTSGESQVTSSTKVEVENQGLSVTPSGVRPIITIEPEDCINVAQQVNFQPVSDDKPGSSTFSPRPRSVTPSMISKAPPLLPYYQDNLVPHFHPAISTSVFDPTHPEISRSPSPHPGREQHSIPVGRSRSPSPFPKAERAKSPAPGPPPNPLQLKEPLPCPEDSRVHVASENLQSCLPDYKSRRDLIEHQRGLDFHVKDRQDMVESDTFGQIDSRWDVHTGAVQRQVQQILQESDSHKQHSSLSGTDNLMYRSSTFEQTHQKQMAALSQNRSHDTEMSADGRTQVQRRRVVTEEVEKSHKESNIQIEKSVTSVNRNAFSKVNVPAADIPMVQSIHITNPQHIPSPYKSVVEENLIAKVDTNAMLQQARNKLEESCCKRSKNQTQPQLAGISSSKLERVPPPPPVRKTFPPGSLAPIKHVSAPCEKSQKPSANVKSSSPEPDTGAGTGRQTGGITAAPKRGRGVLNTAAIPEHATDSCCTNLQDLDTREHYQNIVSPTPLPSVPVYSQINITIPQHNMNTSTNQLDSIGSSPKSDYSSHSNNSHSSNSRISSSTETAKERIITEINRGLIPKLKKVSLSETQSPRLNYIVSNVKTVIENDVKRVKSELVIPINNRDSTKFNSPQKSLSNNRIATESNLPDHLTFANNSSTHEEFTERVFKKFNTDEFEEKTNDLNAKNPICWRCNFEITRGPFITALGKIWCPQHFVCATPSCRRPLHDLGFVEDKGQLYCEYCFEQYLAPPCSKCNGKIKGDCLKAIGKNFHPECFNCVYCGKLFGNNPFFLEDGNPYCDADWNELFTTKCFACGFPVEAGDRWVEALSNNYHSQCFNCTMCKKNLEGQSFFAKGGRPFCKNHAR